MLREKGSGTNGTGIASVRAATCWCLALRRSSRARNRLKPTYQLLMPFSRPTPKSSFGKALEYSRSTASKSQEASRAGTEIILGLLDHESSCFFTLATLAEQVDVDLWSYQSKSEGSIQRALDFLVPFAIGERVWKHQQISAFNRGKLAILLRHASLVHPQSNYGHA